MSFGDKLSVYSDKAYRKNNGRYFEAVGNVVIISQKDTIYGELASLDQETMLVKLEGNVRVITQDMTLYGSHVDYNISTGTANIKNARIMTTDFNLVANELIRLSETDYVAKDAEFSTCKDCKESWSVFGKEIRIKVGQYAQLTHALAKIKGVNVLYLPYVVFPLQAKRKTGLLFPKISNRLREGMAFEQPVFWAIDDSKDATISPTFWAIRGYGGDVQYRQRFAENKWLEFNSRLVNDKIYEPGRSSLTPSGNEFFRYFTDVEHHSQWSPNLVSHVRYTGARDLDMVRDNPVYTDPRVTSSDFGLQGNVNYRTELFSMGAEADYLRNQLTSEPGKFDGSYVQVMPRLTLSSVPYSVHQSSTPGLQHISVGMNAGFNRFRQVDQDDQIDPLDPQTLNLRNADRLSAQPYVNWNFFTWGPVSVKSRYTLDQQYYNFPDPNERSFSKNAGLLKTEISFTMDKVFGLAYEEKIPIKYIPEGDLKKLREKNEQGLTPIQKTEKSNRLIGEMPAFEAELAKDTIVQVKNSYRHSQEFKFLHHYMTSESLQGNARFRNQIEANNLGWFDYEDGRRSQEFLFGASATRTLIPPSNTVELQWNNTLLRKTPKTFSYLDDDKYLRDNFSYNRIGYFNVSQGYLLNENDYDDYRQRLTRLMISTGYNANRWSVAATEYYFHHEKQNIFNTNVTRRFDYLNIFANYTYNSFIGTKLNFLAIGGQVRPTEVLGLAILREQDLEARQAVRTIYSVDLMPYNNCWILNLNYRQTITDDRFSFNIMWNFGQDQFDNYRNNYFAVKRL